MSTESDAREKLGLFLREFREDFFNNGFGNSKKKQLSRARLAGRAHTTEDVIRNLEHGVINPERHIFERVIRVLRLEGKDREEAYRLLNLFSTLDVRRWTRSKRTKFHLGFDARVRRHPRNHSFNNRSHR